MLKDKKGIVWFVPVIVVGVLALIGVGTGWWASYKINSTINSIPTWAWIGIIIFFILLLLPKKK